MIDPSGRNRGVGRDGSAALARGRIGALGGCPARTFSFRPGGISKSVGKGGACPDYIAREGDYERKHADLVMVGGRGRDEMNALMAECHEGTVRKDGKVALTPILELPHELDVRAWRTICGAAEDWFACRGYACMWAIHNPPKKRGRPTDPDLGLVSQPHAHFVVVARPLIDGHVARGGGGQGKPAEAPTIWGKHTWTPQSEPPHPDSFRACKEYIARICTDEMQAAGLDMTLYPGKMRDIGIAREPEKRIPAGAWFAGKRGADLGAVEAARMRHRAKRQASQAKAAERAARKAAATAEADALRQANADLEQRNVSIEIIAATEERGRMAALRANEALRGQVDEVRKANADLARVHELTKRELARSQQAISPKQAVLIDRMRAERGLTTDPDALAALTGLEADQHVAELRKMPPLARQEGRGEASPPPAPVPAPAPQERAPAPPQAAAEPLRLALRSPGDIDGIIAKIPTAQLQPRLDATKAAFAVEIAKPTKCVPLLQDLDRGAKRLEVEIERRSRMMTPVRSKPRDRGGYGD